MKKLLTPPLPSRRSGPLGFTLIELLVVVAIIGLLVSIASVVFGPARKKARDAKRQSEINQINLAMEMYYSDNNSYIDTTAGANTLTSIGTYMSVVPKDPLDSGNQRYTWTEGTTQYYCIYVKLENVVDTWFCASNKGTAKKTAPFSCTPNTAPCNADCCGPDLTQ